MTQEILKAMKEHINWNISISFLSSSLIYFIKLETLVVFNIHQVVKENTLVCFNLRP